MARALIMAASQYAVKKSGFNPQDYRYTGTVGIAHIVAGGEEYGFMTGQGGSVNPVQLDARNIYRITWKRKESYPIGNRELVISIQGTTRPNITRLALVKDGQLIVEVDAVINEGSFGEPRYTMIFLTGEADMPISGTVDLYIV